MTEQKFGQWWRREDEGMTQVASETESKSGGCGCGGCGCGGGKKKGREGQPVDEEGRINLGLRSSI